MKTIQFFFSIRSSHYAAEPDFSGSGITEITDGEFFRDADCFGYEVAVASIEKAGERYRVAVEFANDVDIADAVYFVESFASLLTYQLSFDQNHFYGSPFVEVAYDEFYRDNGDGLRDHLNMKSTRKIGVDRFPAAAPELHELVHFYFLGMQSNNSKAKFFNLFLIMESIEASPLARTMYADGTLFTAEEIRLIQDVAAKMTDTRRAAVVRSIISRTEESRHVKLSKVLHSLGVAEFQVFEGSAPVIVTPAITKELIEARNKLFHKGNAVDENLIWGKLIPISRAVIQILLGNQNALLSTDARPEA
ncbi:hypothetical protein [Paraburkholderia terrae]